MPPLLVTYINNINIRLRIPLSLRVEPLVHEILELPVRKKVLHHHRKSKVSELDGNRRVLRMVDHFYEDVPMSDRKVLFALGNEAFRSNINLTSTTALGYKTVLVDEYLTSTMCLWCVENGRATRLAKPSIRT
ncbi:hypothetical protein FBU30_001523, partial [Linnemannia zychae]